MVEQGRGGAVAEGILLRCFVPWLCSTATGSAVLDLVATPARSGVFFGALSLVLNALGFGLPLLDGQYWLFDGMGWGEERKFTHWQSLPTHTLADSASTPENCGLLDPDWRIFRLDNVMLFSRGRHERMPSLRNIRLCEIV